MYISNAYESRKHKLSAQIILATRFSTSLQPQVWQIYHVRRCISIISALTHQICQLGKPWAAAVVRKPKQITLGLTPRHIKTKVHQGTPRHIKLCQQGTPKVHQGTPSSATKAHKALATKGHHTMCKPTKGRLDTLEEADNSL